jgi:hypothetical protein
MSSLRTASRIAGRWRRRESATSFLSATLRDSLGLVTEAPPRKTNGWFHLVGGAVLTPRAWVFRSGEPIASIPSLPECQSMAHAAPKTSALS